MDAPPLRVLLAAVAAALAIAGCGSSATAPKPSNNLDISVESFGGSTELKVPASVNAGVVQMRFHNQANGTHGGQIVRMDPGHNQFQALKAGRNWAQGGKALPGWLHLEGGFGAVKPGQTLPGVAKLIAGNYAVIDTEARGKPIYATFAVKGSEAKGSLPSSPSTVRAVDYSFTASGLQHGASFLFENRGAQPHEVSAARLKKGKTLADVRAYVKKRKGASPIDESTGTSTAIIDGGASQLVTLNLKPGRYALLCFVPDRKGGPPHALRGMVAQTVVR